MPVDVRIKLQSDKIDISAFSRKQIEKASSRAINQAMAQVKTQSVKQVAKIYRITAGEIRKDFFVLKSSPANLTSKLYSTPYTKPLVNFNPVEVQESGTGSGGRYALKINRKGEFSAGKTRSKTIGLTVEITRGEKTTLRNAFLMFNGSSVTVRAYGEYSGGGFNWNTDNTGKRSRLKTFSVAGAMRTDRVLRPLVNNASEIYAKTYYSQLSNLGKF
jgi:hypothetical protein